jgi:hypothetical protein
MEFDSFTDENYGGLLADDARGLRRDKKQLPPLARSSDRKKSPWQVSRKREYFRYGPETFGIFSLKLPDFGVWRQP